MSGERSRPPAPTPAPGSGHWFHCRKDDKVMFWWLAVVAAYSIWRRNLPVITTWLGMMRCVQIEQRPHPIHSRYTGNTEHLRGDIDVSGNLETPQRHDHCFVFIH
ncbi:hypothetical protein DPEC_G00109670 [Dallia pectoralis]|uniref:Uncharacterized protein n=1 Tax=Dallia pectoralis TaxID=75939 RepID=A0ACC2GSG6_DALPE|nr:hypothetical protein DPEC_G00109670 [Dallia pectoralis]